MKITDYSFGRIVIEGTAYTSDVIIFPDRVYSSWWRKEGHLLQVPDLTEIIAAEVHVLVVGTGYYGAMRIPGETIDYIKSKKIELHSDKTAGAVKLFNEISAKKSAVAALHLTC